VTYFIPIVAVAIGLWSGEKLIFEQFLAMLVIIGGVLLVNLKGKKSNK
jgi:drug/metabolite transporter (DMT)-like permease